MIPDYSPKTRYLWIPYMYGVTLLRPKSDFTYLKYEKNYFSKTRKYLRSYGMFKLNS